MLSVKKMVGSVIYGLVGAVLILAGIGTATKGLKEDDRREYERVVDDVAELGNLGFPGFDPLDYKVAFSTGEKDFVVTYNGGEMEVSERKAVYEGLVGSIYQNGDEFEVVVPVYDTWISTGSKSQLSSVIWHESFHAYQNTAYRVFENVTDALLSETKLAEQIDHDPEKRKLYARELEILSKVAEKESNCDFQELAIEYIQMAEKRDALLTKEEKASEEFYEMMEGSACYVEACVVRLENGEPAYEKLYLENAGEYAEGNAKYYRHGMLECMLLDELDPQWKESYHFDKPLTEVIYGISGSGR